jgi:serine/threonine-protein kinase
VSPRAAGQVLGGRYRLDHEIARGGMAAVWAAHDTRLDRRVAVKLLHPQFADEPEFLERFRREARAAASLNHPNVVSVYDVGEDTEAGTPFLVMELVEGETLKDRIRRAAPLPDDEIRQVGAALGATLDFGHRRGIVHRDVKPQNVLLGDDGRPRLTDFGIAQALESSQLTRTGAVMGSVHYLAPELVRGRPATAQSDVYALGAVLYEMATGRVPFSGETDLAIALAHVEELPPAPRTFNARLAPDLERTILHALAKAPEARQSTAAELAAALRTGAAPAPSFTGAATDATQRIATPAVVEAAARPPGGGAARGSVAQPATTRSGAPNANGPRPATGRATPQVTAAQAAYTRGARPGPSPAPAGRRVVAPPRRRGRGGGFIVLLLALTLVLVALGAGFFGLATLSREGVATPEPTLRATAAPTAQPTTPPKPVVAPTATAAAVVAPTVEPQPTAVPTPAPTVQPSPTVVPSPTSAPPTPTRVPATPTPRVIAVPALRGKSLEDARAALQAAGLTMIVRGINVNVARDVVADQSPAAGTTLGPGSTVTVMVGTGNVTVPDVAGRTQQQATRLLQDDGFRVTARERRDPRVPVGNAIETRPPAGTDIPRNAEVDLFVSR